MNTNSLRLTGVQLFRSILLVFGSFMFAFILNSYVIHEAGHAFGGMLFGCKIKSLIINPFGTGDWISECPFMTLTGKVIQAMGGAIFGLPVSFAITLLLWRRRKPILMPLLMSAPVVCIGNFLGVLDSMVNYPGHIFDYGWLIIIGVPTSVVWLIGIISLVIGIILMNILLPLLGIGKIESFWKVWLINISTWPLYLLIRLFYQALEGKDLSGPMSLLVLGVILVTLTAIPFRPIIKSASRYIRMEPVLPSIGTIWLAMGLGVGLTVVLTLLYPI